jgi:hypothetical protein
MTDMAIVEKSATPRSIQISPPYISRAPYYFTNPTFLTYDQWRMVAREPVTRLCIRHIIRELVSFEWDITSPDPEKDADTIEYYTNILEAADDNDGFDSWLSRVVQDALELPIGGVFEPAPDNLTGLLGGVYHVDGATVFPTYDPDVPFVQVDPYNTAERIWFGRGELCRLILMPRVDLRRRPFQESPVESAFIGIESLSKIYIYYMRQLGDTPVSGILDLMDMSQDEAIEWAVGFRELFDGIDPLKVPILYDHTKPARFIPFGRTPQDLSIIETFKRYAELVCAAFGLSIDDLRLFEHTNTKAGVQASQKTTARAGVGYYAQVIEDMINRYLLMTNKSGLKFRFKLGMTGELQAESALNLQRIQMLNLMTGNQPILKPVDAQKQAMTWKIIEIEPTGMPQPPGLPGLEGFDTTSNLDSLNQDTGAINDMSNEQTSPISTIDAGASEFFQKSIAKRKSLGSATRLADQFRRNTNKNYLIVPSQGWYHVLGA